MASIRVSIVAPMRSAPERRDASRGSAALALRYGRLSPMGSVSTDRTLVAA